ncbi:MAG: AfsR/SARP family transcriptional regulator [Chloroflexota bacterium]
MVATTVDPRVTFSLLIATLETQRQTNRALDQILRAMARIQGRTARRARSETVSRVRTASRGEAGRSDERQSGPRASTPSAMPPPDWRGLHIRCFGRFEALRDGVPIDHWRRWKAKALLKHLVVRRQPVARDVLIDLLWPESDPQTAVNGLRVALHALRQALGPAAAEGGAMEYVIFENGNYSVNHAARMWVDADEFGQHFTSGRRLERLGQSRAAIAQFESAEILYRDDYLLEDLYEDWTLVRREELKDQYLMVLTKLADGCLEQGDAEGCIVRCHKILQKDACREDAYRRLMRCYAQLGQPSQALHWFELCARTLRQELDVAPSEQTMDLYHRISGGHRVDHAIAPTERDRPARRPSADRATGETRKC